MYICECGKEFENSQSFNGHKGHCKEHQLAKYGIDHYQENIIKQKEAQKLAVQARSNNLAQQRELNNAEWKLAQYTCEKCGKIMTEKYGSGRFCSETCAKSREFSDETKQKLSIKNKGKPNINRGNNNCFDHVLTEKEYIEAHTCRVCGKFMRGITRTGMCQDCLNHSEEGKKIRIENGKKSYEKMVANGTHCGWQSRNITSYPEQFFKEVLKNNNIEYEHNLPVKHNNSNYFLDFAITKNNKLLDLEIDGKQHKYEDRLVSDQVRDEFLTSINYIVYRIDWNEINTENGKELMKEKINKFLEFYNNL